MRKTQAIELIIVILILLLGTLGCAPMEFSAIASPGVSATSLQETPNAVWENDEIYPSPYTSASAETKGLLVDTQISNLDLSNSPKEADADLYAVQENKYLYELDENGNQFSVCYPSLICHDEAVAERVNTILYELAFNNLDVKNAEQLYNLQINTKYYITHFDNDLVSILFETSVYDAFHAHDYYNALTFNPVDGALIKLDDVGVDYDSVETLVTDSVSISSSFDIAISGLWEQLISDYKDYTNPLNNFYIGDNNRIGFIFFAGGTFPDNIIVEIDFERPSMQRNGPSEDKGTMLLSPASDMT